LDLSFGIVQSIIDDNRYHLYIHVDHYKSCTITGSANEWMLIAKSIRSGEYSAYVIDEAYISVNESGSIKISRNRSTLIIDAYYALKLACVIEDKFSKARKPIKPIILYPRKCPKCSSPARKSKAGLFCSNKKCRVAKDFRNQVLKMIPPSVSKAKEVDADGYVLCPECGCIARGTLANATGRLTYSDCSHRWKHEWKNGQKCLRDNQYFIWNATTYGFSRGVKLLDNS
jgi:hypothetical protein